MRLVELNLERYGPFTERVLAFRPDARLHVVLGANEAGKSSSLAAITDLLYGIPRQTGHDFLHPAKDLMLSASIIDRAGRPFRFTRRKNKPQLSDASGRELPAEALAPYLGGVSRAMFQRAFGLDAGVLRQSGDELRDTQGELGSALFSAAAGLRGLEELRKRLGDEAALQFTAGGKARRYNVVINRLNEAKRAEREGELAASGLRQLERGIAEAEARLEAIAGERRAIEAERAHLELLRRARPLAARLDQLSQRQAALGPLPAVESGFGALLAAALARATETASAAEAAVSGLNAATAEVDSLVVDTALLDRDGEIGGLVQAAAALRQAEREAATLAADLDRFRVELDDCAARLGLADGGAVEAGRLDDATLARLASTIARGRRLADDLERATSARARLEADYARQHDTVGRDAAADPAAWREAFTAIKPATDRLAASADERPLIATEARAITEAARRLDPAVADLNALADAALPGRDSIDGAATRAAELQANCRDATREHDQAEAARTAAADRLAALVAAADLPTPERIAATRADRDGRWRALRAVLTGAVPAGPGLGADITDFEAALRAADTLADAAERAAARVAAHRRAVTDLQEADARLIRAVGTRAEAEAAEQTEAARWLARWERIGITPATPEAMRRWRADLDTLFVRRVALISRSESMAATEAAAAAVAPVLDRLALDLDLPVLPGLALPLAADRVGRALAERERAHGAALQQRGVIAGLARAVAEAGTAESAARAAVAAWRDAAAADWAVLGLAADAGLDEAAARLAVWTTVPGVVATLNDRRRRQAQLDRDRTRFAAALAALAGSVAPDLDATARDITVAALDQRLVAAREARTRREAALRRLAEARGAAETADVAAAAAAAEAGRLTARLGAAPGVVAEVESVAARLVARDGFSAEIAAVEDQLALAADGADAAALAEALAGADAAATLVAGDALEARRTVLESEASSVAVTLEETRRELLRRGDSGAAELAAQERRMAEAELAETAETWLVLSLSALLVGKAIETRRGADHGPMMARAGALFAALTGGAFPSIDQSYDDADRPLLVGRRASGAEVHVAAMSEGTRDQLFLALRLAALESFADEAEPPPFIGDDLFASFDDARTRHGLTTLAGIGARVQPILFTHHGRVAEMAVAELGTAVDIIEL